VWEGVFWGHIFSKKIDNVAGYFSKNSTTLVSLFRKVRYCCQTIFKKSSNLAGLFLESWITLLNFFENPQLMTRSFFEIRSSRIDLFPELLARDRKFSKESVGGRTSCRALEMDQEDGGCRPHTPTSEEFRRPRRGAPAADQGGINRTCPARAR